MRILLVEDESSLSRAIEVLLTRNNYSVDAVFNGYDAVSYAECGNYDAMILDLMLPGIDGFTVLRKIREAGNPVPVLILSARSDVDDKVRGLDIGANDYLTKPFEVRELLARIRAMTRASTSTVDNILRIGNLELDTANFTMRSGDKTVRLANREYQIMELLMRNPSRLISSEMFMEKIWGYNAEVELNIVWVYLSYIRKKLADIGANVEIKVFRNSGYSIVVRE